MNKRNLLTGLAIIAVVSALALFFLIEPQDDASPREASAGSGESEPLYWVAPMDPDYRRDEPGLSPMGMELVPVYEESGGGADVVISPVVQQNLGVRTASVRSGEFRRQVSVVGYTAWDESTIEVLNPRAEGWLERFNIGSVGDRVEEGQILYELYAPRLVSAQREYLNAAGNSSLRQTTRERLLALGLTENQIEELDRRGEVSQRLAYRADTAALVSEVGAREGAYVTPEDTILTLASLDQIWIDVEVPMTATSWMQTGLPVTAQFSAFPGETWEGTVALVYPELNPQTRSLRLRVELDNPGHQLKPNMFASVEVEGEARQDVITVPREAVIRSGQGARVLIAAGDGRFNVRPVRTGLVDGDRIEVLEGLESGAKVVVSGQFLLDSEANGEQAMARLDAAGAGGANAEAEGAEKAESVLGNPLTGTGTIETIAEDSVTLSHGAIEALNWPAMTMGFQVGPELDLAEFSEGDEVMFDFIEVNGGHYRIVELRQAQSQTGTGGQDD